MKGRKPVPAEVKRLRGNPGKRAIGGRSDRVPPGVPSCPSQLSAEAKTEWRRVCGVLLNASILTVLDRFALAAYCELYANWIKAESEARKQGFTMTTEKGNTILNPARVAANMMFKDCLRAASELGLTPISRERFKSALPQQEDELLSFIDDAKLKIARPG